MAKKKSDDGNGEIAKTEDQLPARAEDSPYAIVRTDPEQIRDIVQLNLQGKKITAFSLDRVSLPDGKSDFWTVPTLDGSEAIEEISGVIVDFKDLRAWWPDSEPTGTPPSCRSGDCEVGYGCRETEYHYKDDNPHEPHLCEECLYAQFGSDPKGKRGQWCKQMRVLLIVRENMYLPMCVFIPPTSLGGIEKYLLRAVAYGQPFNECVTGLSLDKEKNQDGKSYNVVIPRRVRTLSEPEKVRFRSYSEMIRPAFSKVQVESNKDFETKSEVPDE